MSTVTPFIRRTKKDRHGKCSIGLRFEVNGKQATLSLDQKIHPSKWSKAKQRVRSTFPESGPINAVIDASIAEASQFKAETQLSGKPLSATKWRDSLKKDPIQGDVFGYAGFFLSQLNDANFHYARRLKTTVRDFQAHTGKRLLREDFTEDKLRSYNKSMTRAGLSANTRSQRLRTLKSLLNHAVKDKAIPDTFENPFSGFDMPRQTPTKAFALNETGVGVGVDPF